MGTKEKGGHETPPANHIEPALPAIQSQQAWCPYALGHETPPAYHIEPALPAIQSQQAWCPYAVIVLSPRLQAGSQYAVSREGIFMHAALSEDLAQHKKARWLTPAIFAILRVTLVLKCCNKDCCAHRTFRCFELCSTCLREG